MTIYIMISIDGAIGGGSVLRVAIPLAISLDEDIKVYNIRANRSKPGLRTQHLLGLQLISSISGYSLQGGDIGSTEIKLLKGEKVSEHANLNINTAASVSLILQIAINYAIANNQDLSFSFTGGGTFTEWSPTLDYCQLVLQPLLSKIGIQIDIDIHQHGFYPKGGAKGSINVRNTGIKKFEFQVSPLIQILVRSLTSTSLAKSEVAEREIRGFSAAFPDHANTQIEYVNSVGSGTCLSAFCFYQDTIKGTSVLGKPNLRSEKIGNILANQLKQLLNEQAAVDEYMADQLLVPLVIASGSYTIPKITDHVLTNIAIIKQVLNRSINIKELDNSVMLSYP
ncbi:MAG: RNA 3'-terminal phosphate cyclase [Candidatus Heimdallarchaeota archaeon]|nr:RNA 3'-terminal phosphate cyclase [Candidatus Heimdallarchaeota archaeon]